MELRPAPIPSAAASHEIAERAASMTRSGNTPSLLDRVTTPGAAPSGIHLAIEHLVLRGFPSLHPGRLQEAFVNELTQLLAQAPVSAADWTRLAGEGLPALRLKFTTTPTAAMVGRRIARAIVERVAPGKEMHR